MTFDTEKTKSSQLKQQIIRLICDGTFPTGSRLPSERDLEERFTVSRGSVRKAIDQLIEQGYLYRESGCRPVIATSNAQETPEQPEMAFVTNLDRNVLFDIYRLCYEAFLQECNRNGIRLTYVDLSQPLPEYLSRISFQALFVAGDFRTIDVPELLRPLRGENTRIFFLDDWSDWPDNPEFCVVATDNLQGGALAAQTLLEAGCRHPVLVGRRAGYHYAPFVDRRTGFLNELHRHDCSCHICDLLLCNGEVQMEPLREYLEAHPDADGIFTISDALGIEVIHLLNRMGRRVPEELRVLGFDGLPGGELTRPRLSTIAQPVRQIVESALHFATAATFEQQQHHLPCNLIERDTLRLSASDLPAFQASPERNSLRFSPQTTNQVSS